MVLISPLSPNTTNAPTVEPSEAPQVRSETPVSQVTPVSSIASAPVAAVSKESINENVQALVQDLKQLLSEQSLKLLLQLLPALDDAKNAVLTIHDQSSDQQLLSSPLERELQRIFKAIENSGLVIDEKSLADSSQTFAALKNFAALQLQDSLKEIKEALAATASKLPSLPEVRLLNEIVKEISFTLSKDGQTIELTKESINSLIIGLNRLFSAISNELEASNSSKIRPEITKALSELISNLEQALKENAPAKSITNTLDRAVVNFKEFFNGYEPKEILKTHELKEFVAAVEQFTTAQADLAKINTLLQAFNEPSLYMFVALFGGNLSRIKFSHDEACEDGSKKSEAAILSLV